MQLASQGWVWFAGQGWLRLADLGRCDLQVRGNCGLQIRLEEDQHFANLLAIMEDDF